MGGLSGRLFSEARLEDRGTRDSGPPELGPDLGKHETTCPALTRPVGQRPTTPFLLLPSVALPRYSKYRLHVNLSFIISAWHVPTAALGHLGTRACKEVRTIVAAVYKDWKPCINECYTSVHLLPFNLSLYLYLFRI